MTGTGPTVLVADDDPRILQLLRVFLEKEGYHVLTAGNGSDAIRIAQEEVPDIILVDVMMPQMDGFEVCRQLRNDTRTSHLPILMLTSRSATQDKVTGFESGADDYVTKPFELDELLARMRSLLRRAGEVPVRSPLTGLSGNRLLREELRRRLGQKEPFALLYVDLDSFKAFNDAYGFLRGDEAIQLLARLIRDVVAQEGAEHDFIGHIGGDDFAIITEPSRVEAVAETLIERFDRAIPSLYDPEDLERGYLRGYDRHGVPQRFPVMTISIGVVLNEPEVGQSLDQISRVAAEMKRFAKRQVGSSYAVDRRRPVAVSVKGERRGRSPTYLVAMAGAEGDLLELLRMQLERFGHLVSLFASGRELLEAARTNPPDVIVLDAVQEDGSVWDLCREIRALPALEYCPIVLLSTDPEDEERAFRLRIDAFLLKPFPIRRFSDHVQELAHRRGDPADRSGGTG